MRIERYPQELHKRLVQLGTGLAEATLAIEDLGDLKPQGSGVLCTAIVGGAFIPPAMGALVDGAGFGVAFALPMVCYLYIAWYSGRLVPSIQA